MAAAASLLWSGPLNHYRLVFTLPCSGLRSRVLLDDSPFYSCYRTLRAGTLLLGDERLTLARLGHSGKTERHRERGWEREREMCQQEWHGEKRERTKGKAERERDGELHVNSVCRGSCHRAALSLETLSGSSVTRAAPAMHICKNTCVFVWAHSCARNTDWSVFTFLFRSVYIRCVRIIIL